MGVAHGRLEGQINVCTSLQEALLIGAPFAKISQFSANRRTAML